MLRFIRNNIANPADLVNPRSSRDGKFGRLYVGSMSAASNAQWLRDNRIRAIITMNGEKTATIPGLQKYSYPVLDARHETQLLISMMPEITENIHRHLAAGQNVLVHCHMGMQRAPTVVVHYIMRYSRMPQDAAIRWVRKVRPIAFANGYTFF
jgi:protein-tyrosine phosphatase